MDETLGTDRMKRHRSRALRNHMQCRADQQKRAVSRLIEMTTSPTYIHEEWLPLDAKGRTWESANQAATMLNTFQGHFRSRPSAPSSTSGSVSRSSAFISSTSEAPKMHGAQEDGEDFATEAAYSRPATLVRNPVDRMLNERDGRAASTTSTASKGFDGQKMEDEAAGEKGGITHQGASGPRVNPPRIGEQHVWGTQEGWGKKAGKWGLGAGAFRKAKEGEDE